MEAHKPNVSPGDAWGVGDRGHGGSATAVVSHEDATASGSLPSTQVKVTLVLRLLRTSLTEIWKEALACLRGFLKWENQKYFGRRTPIRAEQKIM